MNYCKCGCKTKVNNEWAIGHHRRGTTFKMSDIGRLKISLAKTGEKNPMFGKRPPNYGISPSESTIKKIKIARMNQVITNDHKIKIGLGLRNAYESGRRRVEDSKLWKGGITPINIQIRRSVEYRLWREAVFKRDNWTCQECEVRGLELHAHHLKPFSLYPELRFAIDNGLTLCRQCHQKTDSWGHKISDYKKVGTQT